MSNLLPTPAPAGRKPDPLTLMLAELRAIAVSGVAVTADHAATTRRTLRAARAFATEGKVSNTQSAILAALCDDIPRMIDAVNRVRDLLHAAANRASRVPPRRASVARETPGEMLAGLKPDA